MTKEFLKSDNNSVRPDKKKNDHTVGFEPVTTAYQISTLSTPLTVKNFAKLLLLTVLDDIFRYFL
jgi:hypothetical protein